MSSLTHLQDQFISRWGILGSQWGISKTMAQVQALLLIADSPLNTDQIMQRLVISRGNAHAGLKDLMQWGLARKVILKGDRKDYYETEKDPWKIFFIVARERRRREIQPLLDTLAQCEKDSREIHEEGAAGFHRLMKDFTAFTRMSDSALRNIADAERGYVSKWLLKLVKARSGSPGAEEL